MTNNGGRPRLGTENRTAAIALRVEPWLRDELTAMSDRSGNSVTRQVEKIILWYISHPDAVEQANAADLERYKRLLEDDTNRKIDEIQKRINAAMQDAIRGAIA